ncbi:hypothetical protein CMV37_23565 [Bacillus cereus]|nr:hypothetical protein CMV37_23565 [Bacillus cereus]
MEDGINFQIGYFETFVIVIKLTEICIYKIKKNNILFVEIYRKDGVYYEFFNSKHSITRLV